VTAADGLRRRCGDDADVLQDSPHGKSVEAVDRSRGPALLPGSELPLSWPILGAELCKR